MKKSIIGALVGAVIIFIWQFLSFGVINFHRSGQAYTEKQTEILNFLGSQGLKEGAYYLPNVPDGSGHDEMEKAMKDGEGKPWALLQYHNKAENSSTAMTMNMIRGFLVNFIITLLFIWIVRRMTAPSFATILISAVFVGLIAFLHEPYTGFIWYKSFDIWAFLLDAVVAWGLVGLWLGWWLNRGTERNIRRP